MSRSSSRARGRVVAMRRWDGRSRITTDWSLNQNDPDLNFSDGDLLVYLHERGATPKHPFFRLHTEYLITAGYQSLVDQSVPASESLHWSVQDEPGVNGYTKRYELYLPVPPNSEPSIERDHRLTMRNFFAWLHDRPLAGITLGASLVHVLRQANQYRPSSAQSNTINMLAYLERRGYNDFRECVDHALACLHLAEAFEIESLWIDAFSHSVGMHHGLQASVEFDAISRATKAMITRGRLEVDVRLDRVGKSVMNFFENDLAGSSFGFTRAAKDHTDQFRSDLHAYFIESHGFWPPLGFDTSFALRRSMYRSMYVEFRALYQYLVDQNSNPGLYYSRHMEGGLCVLQNLRAFDARYKLETLPNPLPLLPLSLPPDAAPFAILKRKLEKDSRGVVSIQALMEASNRDKAIMKCGLVRRYIQFERQSITDLNPIDATEGRKVRWILVYAIFQLLASVISAPKEVRQTEGLSYPLCCQKPTALPWTLGSRPSASTTSLRLTNSISKAKVPKVAEKPRLELRPDMDYLTCKPTSIASKSAPTTPGEGTSPISMKSSPSIKSSKSFKSIRAPSLRRMLHRKSSPKPSSSHTTDSTETKSSRSTHQEILIYGYGNGLNEAIDDTPGAKDEIPDVPRLAINNSTFIKKGLKSARIPSRPTPLSQLPRRTFSSPALAFGPLTPSLPESPTVPGDLPTASSSQRGSSGSDISTSSSNTSTETDTFDKRANGSQTAPTTPTTPAPTDDDLTPTQQNKFAQNSATGSILQPRFDSSPRKPLIRTYVSTRRPQARRMISSP